MKSIEKELASHDKKLSALKDRSSRSNLLIFGMPQSINETKVMLCAEVLTVVFAKKKDFIFLVLRLSREFRDWVEDSARDQLFSTFKAWLKNKKCCRFSVTQHLLQDYRFYLALLRLRIVCNSGNINAHILVNKVRRLDAILLSDDARISVLTETWLHDDVRDEEIVPPNYRFLLNY